MDGSERTKFRLKILSESNSTLRYRATRANISKNCLMAKGGRKVKILKQGLWSKMDPSGPISLKFCMQGSLVC